MRVRRLAARRAVRDALPDEASKPSIGRRRHATPQARMIVRACRTSPPSRWTLPCRRVDPRDRPRHQDLGAEPAAPAAAHGSPARRLTRPTGSRGSSRSETTCRPGRPAPPARRRSCAAPPMPRTRRPPAPQDRHRRSPCRTPRRRPRWRAPAARPPGGAAVAPPSSRRRPESTDSPPPPARGRPTCRPHPARRA